MPNIDPVLVKLAASYGLGYVCTGGGCDYIGFTIQSHGPGINESLRWCALVDNHGDSPIVDEHIDPPDSHSESFTVFVTINDAGDETIELTFSDLRSALAIMASFRLVNCEKL